MIRQSDSFAIMADIVDDLILREGIDRFDKKIYEPESDLLLNR